MRVTVFPGNTPISIDCGHETGGATVTNRAGGPVYYGDSLPVSAAQSDGSLASGASVALYGQQWLFVKGTNATAYVDVASHSQSVSGDAAASNLQAGSYTLVLTDAGKVIELNVASANGLTVPPNSSVAFPVGTVIEVYQAGAGQVTVSPGSGVTLREREGKLATAGQYASLVLRKRATDEWAVSGDVATPTQVILVDDQFTRANSATSLGSTPQAQAWVVNSPWFTTNATNPPVFGINNNEAYVVSAGGEATGTNSLLAYVDTAQADNLTVNAKILHAAVDGIMMRVQDANNAIKIFGTVAYQVVAGAWTQVGSGGPAAFAANDLVEVKLAGNLFTVKVNGATTYTFSTATGAGRTKHGWRTTVADLANARIDDFKVTTP